MQKTAPCVSLKNMGLGHKRLKNQRGVTLVGAMIAGAMLLTGVLLMTNLMQKQFQTLERDGQKEQIQSIYRFAKDNFDCCRMMSDVIGLDQSAAPTGLDDASMVAATCATLESRWGSEDLDYFNNAGVYSWPIKNSAGNWIFPRDTVNGPESGDFYTYLRCADRGQKHLELFLSEKNDARDAVTGKAITPNPTNFSPGTKFCSEQLARGFAAACLDENSDFIQPPSSNKKCTDCMSFVPATAPTSGCPLNTSNAYPLNTSISQDCGLVRISTSLLNPSSTPLPTTEELTMTIPLDIGLEFVSSTPNVKRSETIGTNRVITWDASIVSASSLATFTAKFNKTAECPLPNTGNIRVDLGGNCSQGTVSCLSCNYDPNAPGVITTCPPRTDVVGTPVNIDFKSLGFSSNATNFTVSDDKPVGIVIESDGKIESATITQPGSYFTQIFAETDSGIEQCKFDWVVNEPCPNTAASLSNLYLGLPGLAPIKINVTPCAATDDTCDYQTAGGMAINTSMYPELDDCCKGDGSVELNAKGKLNQVTCEMDWSITTNFAGDTSGAQTFVYSAGSGDSTTEFSHQHPSSIPSNDCFYRVGNHATMPQLAGCAAQPPPPIKAAAACNTRPAALLHFCNLDSTWYPSLGSCLSSACDSTTCSTCDDCPTASPGNTEYQCADTAGAFTPYLSEAGCNIACNQPSSFCGKCSSQPTCTTSGGEDNLEVWRIVGASSTSYTSQTACNAAAGSSYCLSTCLSLPSNKTLLLRSEHNINLINGNRVASWTDQSTPSINVLQNTNNNRPKYPGNVALNGHQGIFIDDSTDRLIVSNNAAINLNSPFASRKIYAGVFRLGPDINNRQVIYEQGGGTRGFNLHVEANQLHFVIWNRASDGVGTPYSEISASVGGISPNTAYSFVGWMDGTTSETGTINLKLSGIPLVSKGGVGFIYPHSGAIAIGGIQSTARFFDFASSGSNTGCIDCHIYSFYKWDNEIFTPEIRDEIEEFLMTKYGL